MRCGSRVVRRHPRKRRLRRLEDTGELIKREIAILKQARHPRAVSLIEVIDDDEYRKVYLILEFVQRGEIIWRKKTDKDVLDASVESFVSDTQI
ncbi:MAG: hypothetical protein Q9226_008177, partial [Calogaya cf. arnoldii]